MNATRITFLLTALTYSLLLSAQRQLRVVDVETLVPVAGANVVSKNLNQTIGLAFMYQEDWIRKEVVVFGQKKRDDKLKDLKNQLGLSPLDAQLIGASTNSGMNLFGLIGKLIPNKWRKSKKESRRERLKRIIEEY